MTDPRASITPTFNRRSADAAFLDSIADWEVWVCEDREFSYSYDDGVTLYVHEGAATLQFESGDAVELRSGDVLTIMPGNKAIWQITLRSGIAFGRDS